MRCVRAVALSWLGLGSGCWVTYVAGTHDDASGGADGSGSSSAATSDASSGAGDLGGDCELSQPDPSCDAFADPLRAFELACYPGVAAATFQSSDGAAWRRAHEFGNAFFAPRFGDALLVLGTGVLAEAAAGGQVSQAIGAAEPGTANTNPDDASLPAPIVIEAGSNDGAGGAPFFDCDGVGDCSDTLAQAWTDGGPAHDLLWWSVDVAVPDAAGHFAIDLAWLSAEFPERIGDAANDTFVVWLSSEAFTGNVATVQGRRLDTTSLAGLMLAHRGDDPMLLRTGFDGGTELPCELDGATVPSCPRGATTGWLTLRAPVHGGETATIVAALFDQGDALLDSVLLLDHFRWGCEPCTPGGDCGVVP